MQNPLCDTIAATRCAQSTEEIHAVCVGIAEAYGFEYFHFAARFPSSFVKPFVLVISGYPETWREHYTACNYMAIDPTVAHCTHSVRPLIWDELLPLEQEDEAVRQLMSEARAHGLGSGFTVPTHGAQGEISLFSMASARTGEAGRSRIDEVLASVHLIAAHLHEAACRLAESDKLPFQRPALTQRERECLLWAAEGKTSWETAQILGISERTVIFHLQNVSEKLGCANRQQAVARAIAQGLIARRFG